MKNRLHDYFEAARGVESLVTVDDVKKLTNSGLRSKKHLNLTHKIMIGTGLITLLSVLFYTQIPVEQPAIKTDRAQETHVIPQAINKEKAQDVKVPKPAAGQHVKPSVVTPEKKTITHAQADQQEQNIAFSAPSPAVAPTFSETNAYEYFDETGRLVLSNEELAALGIITNGNVLEYAVVTDTAKTYTWEGTKITSWPFYRLSVEEHGSRRVDIASTTDTAIIGNSKPFWAAAVTYGDDESSLNVTDNIYGVGYDRLYFNGLRPLLVPVLVNLKAKPGRWSHDLSVVFWFKPTASFYRALPDAVAEACTKRFGTKNEMQFSDSLAHYRAQVKEHGRTKGFDAATVASLKKNYLRLPKDQLKEFGIYPRKDGFYYSGLIKKADGVYWLRIKEKKHYTGITTSRFLKFKKPSTHIPVALTDTLITMVHYLSISDNGQDQNRDSLLAAFKENAHRMLPVLADSGTIIWFRKEPTQLANTLTPSIEKIERPFLPQAYAMQKEKLSPTNFFGLSEVQEQQKRYVTAKVSQYESLGIIWEGRDFVYYNWFMWNEKLLSLAVTKKQDGRVYSQTLARRGALRPFDLPFRLVAISKTDMDSAYFFHPDSFGMQSAERLGKFRDEIGELLPVVVNKDGEHIVCWFTDHPDLRQLLDNHMKSADNAPRRPVSYEINIEKAEKLGLIRMIDNVVVLPVKSEDLEHSFVATSLTYDDVTNEVHALQFRTGPLITFSNRYSAITGDSIAALFGKITFSPLFVTEPSGHFGFMRIMKKLDPSRIKELDSMRTNKPKHADDAANLSYSDQLKELMTVKLVSDKWALICWYEKNEELEKLLNAQPGSDVQRTSLHYCLEGEKEITINAYPNPASKEIEITAVIAEDKVTSMDLYDLTGKHCLSMRPETNSGDAAYAKAIIDHLKDGIYIVTIRTAKGKCYSRKVIKYGL